MRLTDRGLAIRERLVITALLVGLVVVLVSQGWLWRWDRLFYDAQLQIWSRPAPDDIVIIAIDESSLARIGRWPWSRRIHAQLLDRLAGEHPRAIAYDVIFSEADRADPRGDQAFARAIAANGKVVLPILMEQPSQGSQPVETLPLPLFAQEIAALGHVHVELDPDGIARSLYLREGLGEPYWPHLSHAMLAVGGEADRVGAERNTDPPIGSPLLWHRASPILIPYAGPPGHFRQVSFADIVDGNFKSGAFRDKYLLVGTTSAGLGDALPTPVSGFSHSMSGVEIIANVLHALHQNIRIVPMPLHWQILLTALLAMLPMLVYPRFAPRTNLVSTLILAVGVMTLCAALLLGPQIWFPPTGALLALVLSYPLWSWRRLEQAIRHLNQQLDRLQEQQSELANQQQRDLAAGFDFLCEVLPIERWALTDGGGKHLAGTMHWQHTMATMPDPGWQRQGNVYHAAIPGSPEDTRVALEWPPDTTPSRDEQQILDDVLTAIAASDQPSWRGRPEFIQRRIEQVQRATDQLRDLRQFVDLSLANMADAIVVTDVLGQVLLSNSRAEEYLGAGGSSTLQGASLHRLLDVLRPPEGRTWGGILREVLLGGDQLQIGASLDAGPDLLVQVTSLPRPLGVVVTLSDISQLRASERKRNELLGFLSHDLRSPLVSMLALVELARYRDTPEQLEDLLGRMEAYTEKTLDIAEQFLQLAKVESDEELEFQDLELTGIVLNALEQVWSQAEVKQIHLDSRFDLDEVWIRGDGDLLERAFVNLLDNAIKYSLPDRDVLLEVKAAAAEWQCTVIDQGPGIEPEDIPTLFDRFQRLEDARRGTERGVGLGLAFVKAVAQKHGGRIEVESEPGEGSRFSMFIPDASQTTEA